MRPPPTGKPTTRSSASGRRIQPCGLATARRSGWAGSTLSSGSKRTSPSFAELGGDVESADFQTVLLLGMGGSSLCPEVLAITFGQQPGFPALRIVDSTDPAQVMAARDEVNLGDDAGGRRQQIRLHARTKHPQAILLRRDDAEPWAPKRLAAISSPSPIPARRWSRWPRTTASATSFTATRRSAGATRRCRTSAWCRPPWSA